MRSKFLSDFIRITDNMQKVNVILFFALCAVSIFYSLNSYKKALTLLEMQVQLLFVTTIFIVLSIFAIIVIIRMIVSHLTDGK